jgi:hypothetical protein
MTSQPGESNFDLIESAAWEAWREAERRWAPVIDEQRARERFANWWHGEDRPTLPLPSPADDPYAE